MAKGICVSCKKPVGGLFNGTAFVCPACNKCYCKECADRKGFLIKDLISICCGRKLEKI